MGGCAHTMGAIPSHKGAWHDIKAFFFPFLTLTLTLLLSLALPRLPLLYIPTDLLGGIYVPPSLRLSSQWLVASLCTVQRRCRSLFRFGRDADRMPHVETVWN